MNGFPLHLLDRGRHAWMVHLHHELNKRQSSRAAIVHAGSAATCMQGAIDPRKLALKINSGVALQEAEL